MKTNGLKSMNFGFSAVQIGQRNQVVEPQCVAVSTEGNFRITAPVSRALNVAHGDYIMFLNNIAALDYAIANKDASLVEFCQENNLEFGSVEAAIAIHQEFDMWAIAKGIVEYDAKGTPKSVTERLSKKDKLKFATHHFDAMLQSALEEGDEEVREVLSRDGITKDEQIEILTEFVIPRELDKYKGSKVNNPAGLSGVGVSLNFTDSNVWKQLKHDLGSEANKLNRIFDVDIENLQEITLNNGYEDVTVKAIVLGQYTDKEPSRVAANHVEEDED